VRALVIIELTEGIEANLRLVKIEPILSREQVGLECAMEAFVLTLGLRVKRAAM
jgi:hypothetical protein